jgi:hypothetical protein
VYSSRLIESIEVFVETKYRWTICGLIAAHSFKHPAAIMKSVRRDVRCGVSPGNDGAVSPNPLGLIKGHDLLHDSLIISKRATNFVDGPLSTQEVAGHQVD